MDPICLDARRQLFLDDLLIAESAEITRRVCPVRKHPANPVIRPTEPWEPRGYYTYGSVIYDEEEGVYKAWCQSMGRSPVLEATPRLAAGGVYYFTSPDGIAWDKPAVDAVLVDSRPSHLVSLWHPDWLLDKPPYFEVFGVIKDPVDPDPARRYKLGFLYLEKEYAGPYECPYHPGQRRGLGVAFSADGIHWDVLPEPVTMATSDGATHWFRDPATGRYVMFGRVRHRAPQVITKYGDDPRFAHHGGRAVRRSESPDFLHWEPDLGQLVLASDTEDGPGDDLYGMSVFPYEGLYIGLLQVFHHYVERAWLDVQLTVSRDGVHFTRLSDRSPFIPVGEIGAWDRFNNSLANNPPHRVGDELRFYYGGRNYLHGGVCKGPDNGRHADLPFLAGVGMGSVPLDRFCALEASFDAGRLRTTPLITEGGQLHLNAEAPFGRVTVTLRNETGQAMATAAVQGRDGLDLPLNLTLPAGEPFTLEFTLENARLYAFWRTPGADKWKQP